MNEERSVIEMIAVQEVETNLVGIAVHCLVSESTQRTSNIRDN